MLKNDFCKLDFEALGERYGDFAIFGEHLYYEGILEIACFSILSAQHTFERVSKILQSRKNGYFVGFVSYELGILEYGLKSAQNFDDRICESSLDFGALDSCVDFAKSSLDSATKSKNSAIPLIFFRLFGKRIKLARLQKSSHKSSAKIYAKSSHKSSLNFMPKILQNIDKKQYAKDFNTIKNELKNGNAYQINYTQELHLQSRLNALEIFGTLLPRQNTKYKAFLRTPFVEIVSFSPELFFVLKGRKIIAEPMKGTFPRSEDKTTDSANKKALKQDTKNMAENMMIVDLLRNDLHKIAHNLRYKLLQIKSYKTLHQMTSKITAHLRKNPLLKNQKHSPKSCKKSSTIYEIFCALFPCGSISGAPKKSSIEIIKKLEKRERKIYCGAIGVIAHQKNKKRTKIQTNTHKKTSEKYSKKTQNLQATFSVPIRTLFRKNDENIWRYGVGSGIVWDSTLGEEIAELELKSAFLFGESNKDFCTKNYALIETILLRGDFAFLLKSHLARMLKSAKELGFDTIAFQKLGLDDVIKNPQNKRFPKLAKSVSEFIKFSPLDFANAWTKLPKQMLKNLAQNPKTTAKNPKNSHAKNTKNHTRILRLLLAKNGEIKIEICPFAQIKSRIIKIAKNTLNSHNDALYHKSTLRGHFGQIPTQVGKNNIFDFIYLNEKGEICEGSRSNIVILLHDKNGANLYTPSQKSGLLNGVLRENFLHHKILREKTITLKDLQNAEKIFCINSVRGVQEVFLNKSILK